MTIELLAALTIRLNGQDRDCQVGEVLDLPPAQAHRLLKKATGLVRPVVSSAIPPLQPGWLVAYRTLDGKLRGGSDDWPHGTVQECRWEGTGWTVHLTDGQDLPLVVIRAVGETDCEGRIIAAWTVREHGFTGERSV